MTKKKMWPMITARCVFDVSNSSKAAAKNTLARGYPLTRLASPSWRNKHLRQ